MLVSRDHILQFMCFVCYLEQRKEEATKIRRKYVDRVPVSI